MEVVIHFWIGDSLSTGNKLCGPSPAAMNMTEETMEQVVRERELVTCHLCLELLSRRLPSMGRFEYGTHLRRINRHE